MQSRETKTFLGLLSSEYRGVKYFLSNLYSEYGLKYIVLSPYLHLSLIYSFFTWESAKPLEFLDTAVILIAVFIGFSSASFAIFMTLNNVDFIIFQMSELEKSKNDGNKTILSARVRTTFVHFILVQTITLLMLLLFKTHGGALHDEWVYLAFLPYLLFIYSLTLNFAVIYHLFMFSDVWFKWITLRKKELEKSIDHAGNDKIEK